MPPAPKLELATRSLDEEKVSAVDPATLLARLSVAHPVPMKLELLENAVHPDPPSTLGVDVSNHPTFPESEVLPRFNSKSLPLISV